MNRTARAITSILLSLSFLLLPARPAMACAPDLAYAILFNGNHPDLPLKLFAAGNIGIVLQGWAKSYLVVAYRNLIGKPLSKDEQDSVVKLWHDRIIEGSRFNESISPDLKNAYLIVRAKALGVDPKTQSDVYYAVDSFCYKNGIGDNAFILAKDTLNILIAKFGAKSPPVKDWVKAQDGIFGAKGSVVTVPSELPKGSDPILQDARNYQIAAANFYLKKFDKAAVEFQDLTASSNVQIKQIAPYMVLRSRASAAMNGSTTDEVDKVIKELQKAADSADKASSRENILDLLRPVSYLNQSSLDVTKTLASSITNGTSKRFGRDVGDLTFLLDGNAPLSGLDIQGPTGSDLRTADDLADWVLTVQSSIFMGWEDTDEEKAKAKAAREAAGKHAIEMWRQKKTEVWLVGALMTNTLREGDQELFDAAANVRDDSPAYATCRYYMADSLLLRGKKHETRKLLATVWSKPNLPPTTRNIFSVQMASDCYTVPDFLKYSVVNPPEILQSTSDLVSPKFFKLEAANTYQTEPSCFDAFVSEDLSKNGPLSVWMAFTQSQNLSAKFKPVFLRTAWTRAQMLQQSDDADGIAAEVAATNPLLAPAIAKIKAAPAGPAKQFAIASAILKNYGMSPYLRGGAERHGLPLKEFDYYNNNFWVPFPLEDKKNTDDYSSYNDTVGFCGSYAMRDRLRQYTENGVLKRLSDAEKKDAVAERALLLKNHPSRFLGQAVLDWQKTHPTDADVPELLYRIVKLPKWTDVTPVGSEFSKKAYFVLHQKYPGNPWTKKAVCYY